jgi:hypothetical protein
MSGLRLPPVAAPQPVNEASAQTGDLASLPDSSTPNLEPLYWSAPDEKGVRYQITKAKSDYFMGMQSGTEGRTLGGAREATGLANLEYQLAGGVPSSSRLTRFSGEKDTMSPEAITAGLAAAGPVAIAGIARAALAAGASIPAIAARLGMSAAELKLTLAEFAAGAGIIGVSESSYRPEGMRPSVIDRATTRVRGWFDGDEDGSSAAVENLSPRTNRPRVTPEDLRRLNPEVHAGFDEALPSEIAISRLRENSPFGGLSPRAAALDAVSEVITALSPGEKARGRRYAETAAGFPTVRRGRGGLAGLADRGRYGDSMLVHMAPEEVAGLASLTPNGVTINPETGLPEMFNLRAMLPTIVSIGAGIMSGGTLSPLAAAALSGVTTAAVSEGTTSERLGKGLAAGIGSYGMGQLMGSLGSAGAAADPAAAQGVAALPEGGAELLAGGRTNVPWESFKPATQQAFEAQGITGANWSELNKAASANLQDMTPAIGPSKLALQAQSAEFRPLQSSAVPQGFAGPGVGTPTAGPYGPLMAPSAGGGWAGEPAYWHGTQSYGDPSLQIATGPATPSPPSYSQEQLQQAAARAFNPTVKAAQARSAYEAAGPMERLEFAGKGLGQVDLSSWDKAAPGKTAVGDLVTPALQTAVGIGGTLPVEEYEPPARRTYDDQGPYLPAERRRSSLLDDRRYIPGVSPQLTYFAAGTHGKTVSAGLPTLYAWNGSTGDPSDPGDESGNIGEAEAAATAASDNPYGATWGATTATGPHASPTPETVEPPSGMGMTGSNVTTEDIANAMGLAGELSATEGLALGAAKAGVVDEKGNLNPLSAISPTFSLIASAANAPHGSLGIHGLDDPSDPDPSGEGGAIGGPGEDDLPDTDEEERLVQEEEERQRMLALPVNPRFTGLPPATYRPGIDPQFSYLAQEGTGGMTIEENIDVETAAEMPAGVAATTGIMQGAPVEVQDDVEVRLSERQAEEPQNPRERAIYDRAVLALQNELEPEVAQRAIDEFLEVFGPEALHMLQEMVRGDRENGGIVETANGETTIAEGELQGPDVIAGKIVDPVTGEETANLRVGENEYIEPAASLARRAQVAGLPPTPENGAMLRGEEERMLRQAVG